MNKIKFIYFDLGGVFFHWRGGLKILAERFNVPFDDAQGKGFENIRVRYDDQVCRGKMTTNNLWKMFEKETGIIFPKDFNFSEEWVKTFKPIAETHELAKELINKYPVGILTNVYPEIYDLQIKYGLVPDLNYQTVIRSDQVGFVKPEKETYELAQQKCGFQPSEIFYVDDMKVNVEAALSVGWQAIWFDENKPERTVEEIRGRLGL